VEPIETKWQKLKFSINYSKTIFFFLNDHE
jgi:hypothetical protein